MQVCHYRREGQHVLNSTRTLIIDPSVVKIHDNVCEGYDSLREVVFHPKLISIGKLAFRRCRGLREITLYTTIQAIGFDAFEGCSSLKTVNFIPPQEAISSSGRLSSCWFQDYTFASCRLLERIQVPPELSRLGDQAFFGCHALVVADLAVTRLSAVPVRAFQKCISLQSVRLPRTLNRICERAFLFCESLVTVEIPKVKAIVIELEAFQYCESLINISFPSSHTIDESAFGRCTQLQTRLGSIERVKDVFFRLDNRLLFHPVHEMCYYSSSSACTVDDLRRCINNQELDDLLAVDAFCTTPFHILCSLVEPRQDLFQVLLAKYPSSIRNWRDANDKRFMDYLLVNANLNTSTLLEMMCTSWLLAPLARWSTPHRRDVVSRKAQEAVGLLGDKDRSAALFQEAYDIFENYELLEGFAILEMAMWKNQIKSGRKDNKRIALDREHCLNQCGSSVILPNVALFLGMELNPSSSDRIWRRVE